MYTHCCTTAVNAGRGEKEVNIEDTDLKKAHSRGKIIHKDYKSTNKGSRECTKREEMLSVGRIWK